MQPGRVGTLEWSRNGEKFASIGFRADVGGIILSYRQRSYGGEWKDEVYRVALDWTQCNYGGMRAWFRCPAERCGRRVAILYGGGIFACRHCYQLAYESQREPAYSRALSRAQAIRMRLGGSASMGEPFPPKPKGMHWSTYQRLYAESEDAEERSWPPWLINQIAEETFGSSRRRLSRRR